MPGGSDSSSSTALGLAAQAVRPHALPKFEPVYLSAPDAATMPWETWQRLLKLHLVGIGLSTTGTDEQRRACLYQSLGAEGARIAADLCPETDTFDDTMTKLKQRFSDQQSLIFARTRFYRRYQQENEDVLSFITELRKLATRCRFGVGESEHLRDRFVAGCSHDRIRERLLMEPDDLTLDEGLKLAQTVERAAGEAKTVGNRQTRGDTDAINLLRRKHAVSAPRGQRDSGNRSPAQTANHRVNEGCPNCGGNHNDSKPCPARGRTCFKCGKRNHLAAVCCSSSDAATNRYPHSTGNASNRTETPTCINVIYGISRPRCELRKSTVRIGGRRTHLFMDLGAQVSVLHVSVVRALRRMTKIRATSRKLQAYGGAEIATLGTIRLPVSYRNVALPAFEFVVVRNGNSLMGLDLFDALGFEVRDPLNSPCVIEQSPHNSQGSVDSLNGNTPRYLQSSPTLRGRSQPLHLYPSKKIGCYVHDSALLPCFHVASGLGSYASVVCRGEQAVVPVGMRSRVLQLAHEVAAPVAVRRSQRVRHSPLWLRDYDHDLGPVSETGLNSI